MIHCGGAVSGSDLIERTFPHNPPIYILVILLDALISSKLRLKMLYKFFINPEVKSYLRSLESEFEVSSNSVRQELNKLEEAGVLISEPDGNKKLFGANQNHPLFHDLRNILMKSVGIEEVMERIISRLGKPEKVYLTGSLARGIDSNIIDLFIIGDVDRAYLNKLVSKTEEMMNKKIRFAVFTRKEWSNDLIANQDHVLIFEGK